MPSLARTLARALLACAVLLALLPAPAAAQGRRYWATSVERLASGKSKRTHVAVRGRVALVQREDDGDLHLRLAPLGGGAAFVVAECVPLLPCAFRPKPGDVVTASGISRYDREHGWWEVHPVEKLERSP